MELSPTDALLTSAEVAVAFMGFASLVAVFVARGSGGLPDYARLALLSLIDYGIFALLACGLPFVISVFPFSKGNEWQLVSGLMAAFHVVYLLISHSFYREIRAVGSRHKTLMPVLMICGDFIALAALLLNTLGWPYSANAETYFLAAVFWNLFGATLSFRSVVKMVWSSERER